MQKMFNPIGWVFNQNRGTKFKELESTVNSLKKELATAYSSPYHNYSNIMGAGYDGEKTPGELGAAKDYWLLYDYLRIRSWQAYLESEIAQIILNKYFLWVVGLGLKVQPEPNNFILKTEGVKVNDEFVKSCEERFNLFTSSIYSDACLMDPIDTLASEAYKNAIIGGDVLVILRVKNGFVNMQLIDGSHVMTPFMDEKYIKAVKDRGNRIEYGIEINKSNTHVAYYVYDANGKVNRIERFGKKSGNLMAFMVYGSKYRIDNVRGMPLISAVLETLRKLDRYKEATVGAAEEAAKIIFSVEHSPDSTGENPFLAKMQQAKNLGLQQAPESQSNGEPDEYEAAATKIATTTQKQAFNLPIGAALKQFTSEKELYFKDFYTTNIQLVCASVNIPYEVAMAMYNSNYSASRAAIKDWEHTLKTKRGQFSRQFYQPYYNLWLENEILNGKVQANGYVKAMMEENIMAIEAYRKARWLGVNVPHIDPVKEVTAERLKLGDKETPLTTYNQAAENLGSGDFSQNMERVAKEKKIIPKTESGNSGTGNKKPVNGDGKNVSGQVVNELITKN